jgi:hypothetical protein
MLLDLFFVFTPLKALESIVLRMPSEVTPFLGTIIQVGTKYIKFDPVSKRVSLCVSG